MFAGAVQGAIMGEERQGRGCTEVISRVLIQSLESTPVSGRIVDLSFPSVCVVTRWILNIHIFQATYFSCRVNRPGHLPYQSTPIELNGPAMECDTTAVLSPRRLAHRLGCGTQGCSPVAPASSR